MFLNQRKKKVLHVKRRWGCFHWESDQILGNFMLWRHLSVNRDGFNIISLENDRYGLLFFIFGSWPTFVANTLHTIRSNIVYALVSYLGSFCFLFVCCNHFVLIRVIHSSWGKHVVLFVLPLDVASRRRKKKNLRLPHFPLSPLINHHLSIKSLMLSHYPLV